MKIVIAKPCCGTCKHFQEFSNRPSLCGAIKTYNFEVNSQNLSCSGEGFEWWTTLGMEIDVPEEVYSQIQTETRYREVKDKTL